ncbi:WD40 repeat domain-containing protein [Tenggerimyces flavus]|uniref:WD40 repeat domain-containing protein n=1 Tax=Tenggerimyces flavus TaxID=1708749 RepID=A0ABV7YD34_9ACTN|nr:hypothetical protein [Tenggerimyces flavus]MBM7788946.1 hypothetical protein [Tenggerimyces flavus]
MPNEPEELFSSTLRRHADSVEAPTRPFAEDAHVAGRRIERRRLLAALAGAIVLVVGIPLGLGLLGSRGTNPGGIEPARTTTPGQPIALEPRELPRGADPAVPWYHDGKVSLGPDRLAEVGRFPAGSRAGLLAAGENVVVAEECCNQKTNKIETRLWDLKGSPPKVLEGGGPRVSSDGRTVVTSTNIYSVSPRTFIAYDTTTGEEIRRTKIPYPIANLTGFVGDKVAFTYEHKGNQPGATGLWDPRTGETRPLPDAGVVGLTGGGTRLVARFGEPLIYQRVVDLRDPQTDLWPAHQTVTSFSPDGRYATGIEGDGPEQGDYSTAWRLVVYDLRERRVVLRVDSYAFSQVAWEPNGSLLAVVQVPNGGFGAEVIVRCTLQGACERASELRDAEEGLPPVFLLPGLPQVVVT